jgi:hypothetical protein
MSSTKKNIPVANPADIFFKQEGKNWLVNRIGGKCFSQPKGPNN